MTPLKNISNEMHTLRQFGGDAPFGSDTQGGEMSLAPSVLLNGISTEQLC